MCSSSPAHLRIWPVQSLTACFAGYVHACGLLSRIIVKICQQ